MAISIKKLEKSEIEIEGEIEASVFIASWNKAVKKLSSEVKIDGFRTGNIPEAILIKNVGEDAILDEAAELALREEYPKLLIDNKIEARGRPKITITKIARGNPLGYKIITAVLPTISLPDYKNISKKILGEELKKEVKVGIGEIDNVINELRKTRAKGEDAPPEFNDEFVKTLSNFENVADFRVKLEKNLQTEKEAAKLEKIRSQIIEETNKGSMMEVPEVLIAGEQNKMIAEYKNEVTNQGLKWEEYLKNLKKNEGEIKKETRELAEKRVRYNLILKNIAKLENIKVPEEDVTKEAEKLVKAYEGADLDSAKMYVEDILLNAKVFDFLESLN
ncbi:MAG: hypothetical protein HZA94_01690 [Candidatus Vogelbacteria bacterium]|nr:hypothetical protein [Candidatus Vogelbacteria bacterium]